MWKGTLVGKRERALKITDPGAYRLQAVHNRCTCVAVSTQNQICQPTSRQTLYSARSHTRSLSRPVPQLRPRSVRSTESDGAILAESAAKSYYRFLAADSLTSWDERDSHRDVVDWLMPRRDRSVVIRRRGHPVADPPRRPDGNPLEGQEAVRYARLLLGLDARALPVGGSVCASVGERRLVDGAPPKLTVRSDAPGTQKDRPQHEGRGGRGENGVLTVVHGRRGVVVVSKRTPSPLSCRPPYTFSPCTEIGGNSEVRRIMIVVVHFDPHAVESTELRHGP